MGPGFIHSAWPALLAGLICLSACTPAAQRIPTSSPTLFPTHTPITPPAAIQPATATSNPPTATITPLAPTATLTATPRVEVCSPLQGITLGEIPQIVTNGFDPPRPGEDDGHQGVDLAFYRFGDQVGMAGLPILSVLSGRVAAAVKDRPPYGNMIIIETPLESVPSAWNTALQLPTLMPTVTPPNFNLSGAARLRQPGCQPALSVFVVRPHEPTQPAETRPGCGLWGSAGRGRHHRQFCQPSPAPGSTYRPVGRQVR